MQSSNWAGRMAVSLHVLTSSTLCHRRARLRWETWLVTAPTRWWCCLTTRKGLVQLRPLPRFTWVRQCPLVGRVTSPPRPCLPRKCVYRGEHRPRDSKTENCSATRWVPVLRDLKGKFEKLKFWNSRRAMGEGYLILSTFNVFWKLRGKGGRSSLFFS